MKVNTDNCNKNGCKSCGRKTCIKGIPLLSSLTEVECDEIEKGVVRHSVKKGDKLFEIGQKANKLYIISSGKIKMFNYTIDGKEQIVYILSSGDFFGAFNLLKEDDMVFDAIALEDTEYCTIDKKRFDQILIEDKGIMFKILEKAYERILKAESLVERLSTNSLDAKVAGLLLNLVDPFGVKVNQGVMLKLTINREEMGSYAGIARESISRKLKLFQEMGLIELRGSKEILIKDLESLKSLR